MLKTLLSQISILLLVAVIAFAWLRGGKAERYAGLFIGLTWLGALAGQALTGQQIPARVIMLADWVLATSLLVLALRYHRNWLGLALIVQGLSMVLHALYFQVPGDHPHFYLMGINGLSYLLLALLTVATFQSNGQVKTEGFIPPVASAP
jgi:hypothetical protein